MRTASLTPNHRPAPRALAPRAPAPRAPHRGRAFLRLVAAGIALCALGFGTPLLAQDEQPTPSERSTPDVGKRILELPVELVLEGARPGGDTEAPKAPTPAPDDSTDDSAPTDESARVAPGLVDWHADFATATRAAQTSGRPVLLFQLLGRLDVEHC